MADGLAEFRTLVANTAAWQTITGTANAADADDYIYIFGKESKSQPVMVIWANNFGARKISELSSWEHEGDIGFSIRFDYAALTGSTWNAKYGTLLTTLESLHEDIRELAGTSTYLNVLDLQFTRLMHPDEDYEDDPEIDVRGVARWGTTG